MATEAFDPFADDDDDDDDDDGDFQHGVTHFPPPHTRRSGSPLGGSSSRDAPLESPHRRASPKSSTIRSSVLVKDASQSPDETIQNNVPPDDIMKEFVTTFPSMTMAAKTTDQFGFPSNCFSASFELAGGVDRGKKSNTQSRRNNAASGLDGAVFIIAEEMSVIHDAQTNQCSVKVRGNVSLEAPARGASLEERISFDVSFLDPKGHVDTVASKNYDLARPIASASEFTDINSSALDVSDTPFRISIPEFNGVKDRWPGSHLIEYTCGDKLRPVPMLITTTTHELNDRCQIMFQLRVNPRNANSLLDAVILVSVPDEFDGDKAEVYSVGRSIGQSRIDSNWSGITRILSWKLGELCSGAICEFKALIFPSVVESGREVPCDFGTDTKFPVLLRYDSEGNLLSDVDLDCGTGMSPSSVKRKFRVYHRAI